MTVYMNLMHWQKKSSRAKTRSQEVSGIPAYKWRLTLPANTKVLLSWTMQEFAWHTQIKEYIQQSLY